MNVTRNYRSNSREFSHPRRESSPSAGIIRITIERNTWEIPCPPAAVQSPCRSTDLSAGATFLRLLRDLLCTINFTLARSLAFHNTPFVAPFLQRPDSIAPHRSTVNINRNRSHRLTNGELNYREERRGLDEYRARSNVFEIVIKVEGSSTSE